tara:strand:+ start:16 stop:2553 length:2538 start_codon:yes stop_codon:yes gene_type:complete
MLMGATNWMFETDLPDGVLNQSAKFDDASADHMLLNKSANGNRKTFTLSWWMKMGNLFTGTIYTSGYSGSGGSATSGHIRASNQKLAIENQVNNSNTWQILSSRLFRDPSTWYHCVVAIDTTQGTASNRVKLYINGVQETVTGTYPDEDDDILMNNQYEKIGTWDDGGSAYYDYDGYLADFILVDNTALAPTSFGRSVDGVWIPKDTSGLTFGTKGWRLEFKNTGTGTASSSTVGADTSGNDFHFTSYGHPQGNMLDCPDNNWCTLNERYTPNNDTYTQGSLAYAGVSGKLSTTTFAMPSGKWYCEVRIVHSGNTNAYYGIWNSERGYLANPWNYGRNINQAGGGYSGDSSYDGAGTYGTFSSGNILGMSYDSSNGQFKLYKDDGSGGKTLLGTITESAYIGKDICFSHLSSIATGGSSGVFNFGQDSTFSGNETAKGNTDGNGYGDFYMPVPDGFLALCSANLPEPTISPNSTTQAADYFNTKIYTGNGYPASGTQSITGVGFQSDFTWIKNRDRSSYNHYVFDSIRGATKALRANLTNAENTESTSLTSFDSDGFSLGANNEVNYQNDSIVSWNWKAGGDIADVSGNFIKDGVAFTPTQGTIDATAISANTTSGLSIVKFTSDISSDVGETGTPPTVAHGLGATPNFVIVKDTDGGSYPHWNIWHQGYQPDTTYLNYNFIGLQSTGAANNAGWHRTDTGFTTNLFTPPRYQYNETGKTYICYVFSEVEGYSKFGSYVGNGNADGPFVYTGFKPAWLIVKEASAAGEDWMIWDNKRATYNEIFLHLYANTADDEQGTAGGSTRKIDFLSNGFKTTVSHDSTNTNGETYIYMAFAEKPFKYSNAA